MIYLNKSFNLSTSISLKSLITFATFSNFQILSAFLPAVIPITLALAVKADLTPLFVSSKTEAFFYIYTDFFQCE